MIRLAYILLVLLFEILVPIVRAETSAIPTNTALDVFLVNEQGQRSKFYSISQEERWVRDLIFKHSLPDNLANYESWVLEISEPTENRSYQMSFEGPIPALIHWDGYFDTAVGVQARKKYFIRLVLIYKDNKAIASPWGFFETSLKTTLSGPKTTGNYVKINILPTGQMHALYLKTANFSSFVYPVVMGDFRLVWNNIHTFGVKFEGTSNIVFNPLNSPNPFFYSDFSIFYRYFIWGAPAKAPSLPYEPPYIRGSNKPLPIKSIVWGQPSNFEVGTRFFLTTLRGYGGTSIDPEMFRIAEGMTLMIVGDQALGPCRLHGTLEGGYSLFRGNYWLGSAELALTYDRFVNVEPGIMVRYHLFTGTPDDGQPNAGTTVTDQLVMAGVVLYFRL